jgi:hypothetical protein
LLSILRLHINKKIKKKEKRIKKIEKKCWKKIKIYINDKNIPKRPRNYQRLVEEDQNIQN